MKLTLLLALVGNVLVICQAAKCGKATKKLPLDKSNRIVGGFEVEPNAFPWLVQLQIKVGAGVGTCGGTLIPGNSDSKTNIVLTAAHCVVVKGQTVDPSKVKVIVGGHDMSKAEEGREAVDVREVIVKDYEGRTQHNDVAILVLAKKIPASQKAAPICINDKKELPQKLQCYTVGWGAMQSKGADSPQLRAVKVQIVPQDQCTLPHFDKEKQFCAGNLQGGKDSCTGDSGGPLMCTKDGEKFVQYGIVSFGIGCGAAGRPGYYTKLSTYESWIEKTAKNYSK